MRWFPRHLPNTSKFSNTQFNISSLSDTSNRFISRDTRRFNPNTSGSRTGRLSESNNYPMNTKPKTIIATAKSIKIQLLRMAVFSYEIDCELARQKPRKNKVEEYENFVKTSLEKIRQELDALDKDDEDAKSIRATFLESQMRETLRETKQLVDNFKFDKQYPW